MNDNFADRVRAAAIAGWWTLLIAVMTVIGAYGADHRVATARPDWFLKMLKSNLTWDDVLRIMLIAILAMRLGVWVILMIVLWLTIWAHRLRRQAPPAP